MLEGKRRARASWWRSALLLAGPMLLLACSPAELPEAGSARATLYAQRCGGCHVVYQPRAMTAAMWTAMVSRMEVEMKRRGRPLDPGEKAEILAYLEEHAGSR